ncbi:hypothetical protein [Azospirillum sp. Sh1]|uniref:hypothetical protein n=1 Tax=Azospirillum sp. Sh1 TaxID=2607285 RepID=UPI0011EC8F3A|nr:hypothetical protein [Azospirillum sp. Sh1]KAA0575232.1 hypothetical protein FZ029_15855 [Azospirillum sp. Sh1]
MGNQLRPLEHRSEKRGGTDPANRDNITSRFVMPARADAEPSCKADTIARVKALSEGPASGEAMSSEDYLRWLND